MCWWNGFRSWNFISWYRGGINFVYSKSSSCRNVWYFLDHADQYYKHKRKQDAGTIAGVVFEDMVRRIAKIHDVSDEHLEDVNNKLAKVGVLTETKEKRAKVASHVKTRQLMLIETSLNLMMLKSQ